MKEYAPTVAVLLDIDGTLLDSNDAHAFAWVEALAAAGRPLPYERIQPQQFRQDLVGIAGAGRG